MILRLCALLVLSFALAGCPVPEKKNMTAKSKEAQKKKPDMKDQNGDASFQAFLGRLRKAVEARDRIALTSMMAPDFGYRWDNGPEGETPFSYWDSKRLWPRLNNLMQEKWTAHEAFMVAPPQFAESDSYPGYRAGLAMVNGSWRFAYFVPAPPADAPREPEMPEDRPLPQLPE